MKKNGQKTFETTIILLTIICFGIWFHYFSSVQANPDSQILAKAFFLDVGQGDATLFSLPGSVQILVDAGPDNSVLEGLEKYMPSNDRTIEYAFMTHPDYDHIGGFNYVLDSFSIKNLYSSDKQADSKIYQTVAKKISDKKIPHEIVSDGTTIKINDFDNIDIYSPPKGDLTSLSSNDSSIVAKFDTPEGDVMLLGDAEAEIQGEIVAKKLKTELKSDVVKISHHGSSNGLNKQFIQATGAKKAIISVGANNKYGHPAKTVLEYLTSINIKIFRTDEMGTVRFGLKSDGWAALN